MAQPKLEKSKKTTPLAKGQGRVASKKQVEALLKQGLKQYPRTIKALAKR